MRILFVMLDVPFPTYRGQRMRNWALLRVLAEEKNEIELISFAEPQDLVRKHNVLQGLCKSVELVPAPDTGRGKLRGYIRRLQSLPSNLPFGAWRFRSPELQACIRRHLKESSFDLIIWDEVYNLVNFLPELKTPVLLNSHDLMRVLWERCLETEKNIFKRMYAGWEHRKILRWEPRACSLTDGIMACSEHDASLYRKFSPQVPVTVATNSVDCRDYSPTADDDAETLLFVGGMDWFPNRDGVEFFVFDILPELRKLRCQCKFVVVGRVADRVRRRFRNVRELRFAGVVPDVRDEIAKAAVCVVPLRIGSGVRWKILEAGAMGKAMVSTTIGAEGLEFKDGTEILLADDPTSFARAMAGLLADPVRRRSLGAGARKRVEEQYDFKNLRESVREALGKVVKKSLADQDGPAIPVSQATEQW